MPSAYIKKIAKSVKADVRTIEDMYFRAKLSVVRQGSKESDVDFWEKVIGRLKGMVKSRYGRLPSSETTTVATLQADQPGLGIGYQPVAICPLCEWAGVGDFKKGMTCPRCKKGGCLVAMPKPESEMSESVKAVLSGRDVHEVLLVTEATAPSVTIDGVDVDFAPGLEEIPEEVVRRAIVATKKNLRLLWKFYVDTVQPPSKSRTDALSQTWDLFGVLSDEDMQEFTFGVTRIAPDSSLKFHSLNPSVQLDPVEEPLVDDEEDDRPEPGSLKDLIR